MPRHFCCILANSLQAFVWNLFALKIQVKANMRETASPDNFRTKVEDRNLLHLGLVIVFGIFATTLPQPQVLGKLPLQFLLKNEVGVTREQMAAFFFWCGLAWYLKPFAGILTDAFPLFRTRRRHYLLFSSVLASVSWIGMTFVPHRYGSTALGCTDCEPVHGNGLDSHWCIPRRGRTKPGCYRPTNRPANVRLQLLQPCSGTARRFAGNRWIYVGNGYQRSSRSFNLSHRILFLRERPAAKIRGHEVFHNASQQLITIVRSRNLWMALLFLTFFYFSPGFSTPLFYKQTDELHFSKQAIGNLGVFGGAFGILAAVAYSQLIKRVQIRTCY